VAEADYVAKVTNVCRKSVRFLNECCPIFKTHIKLSFQLPKFQFII